MNLDRFRREETGPTIPLTAMVDVLFLMIIFLVLSANFEQVTSVTLPEARGRSTAPAPLEVELRADGTLWHDGRPLPPERPETVLAPLRPDSLLLLPDRAVDVGTLFRWYDRLERALAVPVRVGVRAPSAE